MTTRTFPLPLAAFHVLSDKVIWAAYDAGERAGDATVAWIRREGGSITEATDGGVLFASCPDKPEPIPAGLLSAEVALDYTGLAEEQAHEFREGFLYAIRCAVNEGRRD